MPELVKATDVLIENMRPMVKHRLMVAYEDLSPIYTTDRAFEDEQIQTLDMALPIDHAALGPMHLVGSPLNFDGVPRRIRRTASDGGADSDQILGKLGYTEQEISELRASRVC